MADFIVIFLFVALIVSVVIWEIAHDARNAKQSRLYHIVSMQQIDLREYYPCETLEERNAEAIKQAIAKGR